MFRCSGEAWVTDDWSGGKYFFLTNLVNCFQLAPLPGVTNPHHADDAYVSRKLCGRGSHSKGLHHTIHERAECGGHIVWADLVPRCLTCADIDKVSVKTPKTFKFKYALDWAYFCKIHGREERQPCGMILSSWELPKLKPGDQNVMLLHIYIYIIHEAVCI